MCAKIAPKHFYNNQKTRRNEVSAEMFEQFESVSDLTDEKSWFLGYVLETKKQS
jgi:hypothetical protein